MSIQISKSSLLYRLVRTYGQLDSVYYDAPTDLCGVIQRAAFGLLLIAMIIILAVILGIGLIDPIIAMIAGLGFFSSNTGGVVYLALLLVACVFAIFNLTENFDDTIVGAYIKSKRENYCARVEYKP